jgi:hypothetical protein
MSFFLRFSRITGLTLAKFARDVKSRIFCYFSKFFAITSRITADMSETADTAGMSDCEEEQS